MELTLNLVWVVVALVGILAQVAVLTRAATCSDRPATTRQRIVAMCCALVILFFVISMTDDLHNQAILFEEKKPSRVLSEVANAAPSSAAQATPFVFLLPVCYASLTAALATVRRPVDIQHASIASAILPKLVDGRAPPVSLA